MFWREKSGDKGKIDMEREREREREREFFLQTANEIVNHDPIL